MSEQQIDRKKPDWWDSVVGEGDQGGYTSGQGLFDLAAQHTLYSYLFRPNYNLRRETFKRVQAFDRLAAASDSSSCAVLHVRRGDVLMHGQHSRGKHSISVGSLKLLSSRLIVQDIYKWSPIYALPNRS